MSGGKHEKRGKSRDCREIYIDMKQAAESAVTASKKALGIYKPNLNNRSFDSVLLSQQRGLEATRIEIEVEVYGFGVVDTPIGCPNNGLSELLSIDLFDGNFNNMYNTFEQPYTSPSVAYANGKWAVVGYSSGLNEPYVLYNGCLNDLNGFLYIDVYQQKSGFSNKSFANSVIYANGEWAIGGFNENGAELIIFGAELNSNMTGIKQPQLSYYSYVNSINYINNNWIVCVYQNGPNQVYYGPTLTEGSLSPLSLFGGNGTAKMVAYGNNNYVICGQDKSGSGNNVYYGSSLGSLTPLAIFGNGGQAYSAVYDDSTWVIVGYDKSGSGNNVYYGSSLSSLTPLTIFGDGGTARSVLYADSDWVIVGDNKRALGYNVYYGSDLTSLTPYAIFGNTGSGRGVFYLDNKWVICGKDTSGSGRNVYYGNTLGSLNYYTIFGNGGYAEKAIYEDNTLVMCGNDVSGQNKHIWYYTNWYLQ